MQAPESPEAFWARWTPWRHGPPGTGNFADVMRILRLYEAFAVFATARLPPTVKAVTVIDLACGAAPLVEPLRQALQARGLELARYIGVDFGDEAWMGARTAEVFAEAGVADRSRWVRHDLAEGLPELDVAEGEVLLVTSCWGITYLEPARLISLLRQCVQLAHGWSWAELNVSLLTAGQFDRNVLTRRFLFELVPAEVGRAMWGIDVEPLRRIQLAVRALPRMRQFGAEVQQVAGLMPADTFVEAVEQADVSLADSDTALWGQSSHYALRLGGL